MLKKQGGMGHQPGIRGLCMIEPETKTKVEEAIFRQGYGASLEKMQEEGRNLNKMLKAHSMTSLQLATNQNAFMQGNLMQFIEDGVMTPELMYQHV